ncbi:RimK family alpha-L-glutamate ligase [Tenacibaculum dicentrarchi]|nr:RimK family alpha-L-glutamate ligase [Tenacibaculum dicentrarchi]MCD8407036.1 RimK family alpha-L-glutamate ligase [Tenacibaculum dicentrarchi]MCD8424391.1 RimK family alpha-L-glutamate ligase [Tenacibaculum dicentrarchi]MCD8433921.1 RimK family alpha-L-glutamate ligase [Tenacibaculum dicentrarchi]MCD8441696.1 RimK family alpha-L-glutamate ligase [Tenacibaculum dicentrarchi]
MTIFILSVSDQIYSTQRIYNEANRRGHNVRIINHLKCSIKLANGKSEIIYNGENIIDIPDVIIPRIGASATRHGAAVVKEFELNGTYTTATSLGILQAQNKVRTLQIMNQKNIPFPDTIFAVNPDNIDEQVNLLGGAPIIIKLQEGTHGSGVILAESNKSAKSIIDTMYSTNASILLQEFIKESNSEDIRAFVIGNKVVASMKRKGSENDFRSNIHQGGSGFKVNLSEEEKEIAIKATQYLNLPIAGVDLIRSKRGSLLIEVNTAPGLQGIENYTKHNTAKAIIKFLEDNVYTKL